MDDTRLSNIEKQMTEQGQLLQKVANALLGSLDSNTVGLIEGQRLLKTQVEVLVKADAAKQIIIEAQAAQITDLIAFKSQAKKIITAIAAAVPVAFEIVKWLLELGWSYITNHTK